MKRERRSRRRRASHKLYKRNEVLQQRLQQGLAGPVTLRPNALARLQQRACAPLLRAGPLGRLQQRLNAVAEGHRGHVSAGMPKHAGRARLGGLRRVKTLRGRFKTVAWPRAGLLCKEGQTEHGVGASSWPTSVSVSFDSTY